MRLVFNFVFLANRSVIPYRDYGIAFDFPDDWTLEVEHDGELTTMTVTDGGTAFWTLVLMWLRPAVEDVLEEIQQTFRGEYDEVDVDASRGLLAQREAETLEISFVCLELVSTAWVRVFRTGRFTVLQMGQATDHEQGQVQPVFDAISATLNVDLDGDILIT